MLSLIFAGRLDREKGVEILLGAIPRLQEQIQRGDIRIFICGDGSYRDQILELSEDRRQSIIDPSSLSDQRGVSYYGQRSHEDLALLRGVSDFALMPSLFLETFGLSALESLEMGLPVIGIRKGGLIPFIHEDLALDESRGVESLISMLESLLIGRESREIFLPDITRYSLQHWQERLRQVIRGDRMGQGTEPQKKKILLISDYLAPIGGIETYLHFLGRQLSEMGHEVEYVGYEGDITPLRRKILLFLTPFSIGRYFQIRRLLMREKPDIIWTHSSLRYIGWWGMVAITNYKLRITRTKRQREKTGVENISKEDMLHTPRLITTHHDFGLFARYPSRVEQESDIPRDRSLGAFLRGGRYHIITLMTALAKWGTLEVSWRILANWDLHLVPSDFMTHHVESRGIDGDRVEIFEHTTIR